MSHSTTSSSSSSSSSYDEEKAKAKTKALQKQIELLMAELNKTTKKKSKSSRGSTSKKHQNSESPSTTDTANKSIDYNKRVDNGSKVGMMFDSKSYQSEHRHYYSEKTGGSNRDAKCGESKRLLLNNPDRFNFYFMSPSGGRLMNSPVYPQLYEESVIECDKGDDGDEPLALWDFFTKHISKESFVDDINIFEPFVDSFLRRDFVAPTGVQVACFHSLLKGRDTIGVAKTGSGKTIAFLLPAFIHIIRRMAADESRRQTKCAPIAIILAPTRELAVQIDEEIEKMIEVNLSIERAKFSSACLYGGMPIGENIAVLKGIRSRYPVKIITGCPGRVNDLLNNGHFELTNCTYIVLDEADRMIDIGFLPQISSIIDHVSEPRQVALFSATWDNQVQQLAKRTLNLNDDSTVRYSIGSRGEGAMNGEMFEVSDITHYYEVFNSTPRKMMWLKKWLSGELDTNGKGYNSINIKDEEYNHSLYRKIIFCQTKAKCRELHHWCESNSIVDAEALHGDRNQSERHRALDRFKDGDVRVLFATSVAARGLDIPDVGYVIHFTAPEGKEQRQEFVHKSGRCGRAGQNGIVISLFDTSESRDMLWASSYCDLLSTYQNIDNQDLTELRTAMKSYRGSYGGGSYGGGSYGGGSYGGGSYGGGSYGGNRGRGYSRGGGKW